MSSVELHARERYSLNRMVRRSRRTPVRVDNTPLVDLALLLLTFFICATTMAQPQVLEMRLPPMVDWVVAPLSVRLYLRSDGLVRHRVEGESLSAAESPAAAMRRLAGHFADDTRPVALEIKVAPGARHGKVITLLDEMNRSANAAGRTPMSNYAIHSMSTHELEEVGQP